MEPILRLFRKPTVADFVLWCKGHEVKPPSKPIQDRLKSTSGFKDTLPWRIRYHQALKKVGT